LGRGGADQRRRAPRRHDRRPTRDEALIRWEDAPYARVAQPHEDHLLPLTVAAGAASGDTRVIHFHDHSLGKPISGFRLG